MLLFKACDLKNIKHYVSTGVAVNKCCKVEAQFVC